jgi:hypothetical protein
MGTAALAVVRYPSPLTLPGLHDSVFCCGFRALFQIRAILLAPALLTLS